MLLTDICREGRLETWLPLLPLEGLYEGGLLSTDVRASTTHHKHVKVITRTTGVSANQPRSISLIDGHLKERENNKSQCVTVDQILINYKR